MTLEHWVATVAIAGATATVILAVALWCIANLPRHPDTLTYTSDQFTLTVPINGDPDAALAILKRFTELHDTGERTIHPAFATQVIRGGKDPLR